VSTAISKTQTLDTGLDLEFINNPNRLVLSPNVIYIEHTVKNDKGEDIDYLNTITNFTNEKFETASNIMFAKVTYTLLEGDGKRDNPANKFKPNVEVNPSFMAANVTYTVPTVIKDLIYKFILRGESGKLDVFLQEQT